MLYLEDIYTIAVNHVIMKIFKSLKNLKCYFYSQLNNVTTVLPGIENLAYSMDIYH